MRIDPIWEQMIATIEPEIQELRRMIDEPRYPAVLSKLKSSWEIRIDVEWPEGWAYAEPDGKFEEQLNWTINQLENWPNVRRTSYDRWSFKLRRDAEKFITLYNLKWET